MISEPEINPIYSLTDGEIAVNNLESARKRSWRRFWGDPLHQGIAECIVEQEQFVAQFLGDLAALDRLDTLVRELDRADPGSPRTTLIHAQVASMAHCFADARGYLTKAAENPELVAAVDRLSLSIDQACGSNLEAVFDARHRMAESGRLEDLAPLGALHADLREFEQADQVFQLALQQYQDTSPFAVAWVCFQLGVLWGELVPKTLPLRAGYWYRKAIEYLPCYVKARVHLAEIYLHSGSAEHAEATLMPVVLTGDPEVSWRLAEVLGASGRFAEADEQIQRAQSGFEVLLEKHLLAFADHGAEFYSGSGNDVLRAFELANINLANRPTLRAFEQAHAAALAAGADNAASEILTEARKSWGNTSAFKLSPLAEYPN